MKVLFEALLFAGFVGVLQAFKITDRAKRSYEYHCKETVHMLDSDKDVCHMTTCPKGEDGPPEVLYHPCAAIPEHCPKIFHDTTLKCCQKKCVCEDNNGVKYEPGHEFFVNKDDKTLQCKCGTDKVPICNIVLILPPKGPTEPPSFFPTPPGFFR